jgi:hypothetical protein
MTQHRALKRHTSAVKHRRSAARTSSTETGDDNVQSGDQSTPDTPGQADTSDSNQAETPDNGTEAAGSEVANDDGPGGHADEPGNPNADHQWTGPE